MAEVKKVKLKRFNGTDYDELRPETEWDQIQDKPTTFTPTAHNLNDHSDVNAVPTANGQVLTWDADNSVWVASTTAGGGVSKADLQNVYIYGKASAAITIGDVVQFAGAQGDHILMKPAVQSEINANPDYVIGIAETTLAQNDFGYVLVNGRLTLDTTGYTAGSILYFDSEGSTAGALTATEPTEPNAIIQLAAVSIGGNGNGEFVVRTNLITRNIHEINGLQDALDAKVDLAGDTMTGALTLPPTGALHNLRYNFTSGQAASRNWFVGNDAFQYGTFNISTETEQGNNTLLSRFHIDGSGNVGIGTTSPTEKLEVSGGRVYINQSTGSDRALIVDSSANTKSTIVFRNSTVTDNTVRLAADETAFTFYTGGLERLRVAGDGNVGIGTASPNAKLEVAGAVSVGGNGAVTDASLHIRQSYGGFDRLTQMNPTGNSKPALNLMASTNSSGTNQWWSWGINNNIFTLQPGTSFGGSTGMFLDSSGNLTLSGTVDGVDIAAFKSAYDSHTHAQYAPLASPAFTGNPTAPTPTAGDNDTTIATTAFVSTAISNLVNGASASFDTLKEIQDAMATDTELANAIAGLTIGNGTQTITAGSDLTGGGSFTANQTGNSSVTLNVTTGWWNAIPRIGSDGVMEVGKYIDFHTSSSDSSDYNPRLTAVDVNTLQLNGYKMFHDAYHPNADTWTTARTITIGNTGKSVNGSANVSWSLAEIGAQAAGSYAAASHTHDDRYYTESEADSRFINASGDSMASGAALSLNRIGSLGTEIRIGAGESLGSITGSSEAVYIAGESGVYVYASTDNLTSGLNKNTTLIDTNGNMIINTGGLTVNGGNVNIAGNNIDVDENKGFVNSGAWTRNATPHGYIDFGPANTSYAHIYTDRPSFYFNKELYSLGNRLFHDGYHPNADKWTTARTITLGGDLTGSVSLDGSANVTLNAEVTNGSHTHDDRYYTESEADSRFGLLGSISDFTSGTLVVTNLSGGDGPSWTIEVTGKGYGSGVIKFQAEGYNYNTASGGYYATAGMNYGRYALSYIKVLNYNGNLAFWWPRIQYWNSFEARVTETSISGIRPNRVTSIINSTEPSSSTKTQIDLVQNINNTNIGSQSVNYANSAGNADTVDGFHASQTAGSANTAVVRNSSGYIMNTWFNSSRSNETSAAASYIYDTGDGYMRKKTLANAQAEIVTSAAVTSGLGYTPYNSTNPNGYTSNTGTVTSVTSGDSYITMGGTSTAPTVNISSTTGSYLVPLMVNLSTTRVTGTSFTSLGSATLTGNRTYKVSVYGTYTISYGGTAFVPYIGLFFSSTSSVALDGIMEMTKTTAGTSSYITSLYTASTLASGSTGSFTTGAYHNATATGVYPFYIDVTVGVGPVTPTIYVGGKISAAGGGGGFQLDSGTRMVIQRIS